MDAFETFVRHAPFAAALVDNAFRLTAVSPDWESHGLSPDLKIGDDFRRALVSPEDIDSLERCVAFGEAFSRYRSISIAKKDGAEPRIWRTEFAATLTESGRTLAVIVTARDVSGYAETALKAERDQQRLKMALELDDLMVREYDLRTGEIYCSGTSPELEKWCLFKDDPLEIVHPDDREKMAELVRNRKDGEAQVFEFRLNRDDGVETWVRSVGKKFLGADGKPERLVNLFKDITDRRRQTEAVENLAFKDSLTGLPNRAYFNRKFQEAVDASEIMGELFGLIMIDVDHFKDINDTLGHDAGDALLKRLAEMLHAAFRVGRHRGAAGRRRVRGDPARPAFRGRHDAAGQRPAGPAAPAHRAWRPQLLGQRQHRGGPARRPRRRSQPHDQERRHRALSGQGRGPQPQRRLRSVDALGPGAAHRAAARRARGDRGQGVRALLPAGGRHRRSAPASAASRP
jgi:hypothetical protein